jgi:hypothetical protein
MLVFGCICGDLLLVFGKAGGGGGCKRACEVVVVQGRMPPTHPQAYPPHVAPGVVGGGCPVGLLPVRLHAQEGLHVLEALAVLDDDRAARLAAAAPGAALGSAARGALVAEEEGALLARFVLVTSRVGEGGGGWPGW